MTQEAELRARPDIVVCTPGRMVDHLTNSASVHMDDVEILVLDEVCKNAGRRQTVLWRPAGFSCDVVGRCFELLSHCGHRCGFSSLRATLGASPVKREWSISCVTTLVCDVVVIWALTSEQDHDDTNHTTHRCSVSCLFRLSGNFLVL